MSHKQATSSVQNTSKQLTEDDIAAQKAASAGVSNSVDNSNATIGQAQQTMAKANPFIDSVLTPQANGKTALEQSLTQQLTGQTAKSYQNAMVSARQNALQSGLAHSGAGVGNENAVGAEEASALGQIPSQVTSQLLPAQLAAAGLVNQQAGLQNAEAGTQVQQGGLQAGLANTFNPNEALKTQAQLQEEQNQANQSLWSGLAKAALGAVSYSKGGLTV